MGLIIKCISRYLRAKFNFHKLEKCNHLKVCKHAAILTHLKIAFYRMMQCYKLITDFISNNYCKNILVCFNKVGAVSTNQENDGTKKEKKNEGRRGKE